jgi:hypothetical protein
LAIKSPSFANVPAIGDVEDEFNSLIKTKDVAERKEVLQAISNFFIKKSPVFVTTIKQSANDFKQRRTTIEDYLKTLTNHNPDCTVHEDFYFKEKVKKFHQNF